jgi:hypothetical protein
MGHVKDMLIEKQEREQAARGRCMVCSERLQQGEEEICSRCAWDRERD